MMVSMSNLRDLVAQSPENVGLSFGTLLRSLGVINTMATGIKRLNGTRWLAKHQRRLFSSGKVQILLTPSQFVLCKNVDPRLSNICSFLRETKILKFLS